MSMKKTFAIPGGALRRISASTERWIRNTVSVNITPIPKAVSTARDWLPGRYRFEKACRIVTGMGTRSTTV